MNFSVGAKQKALLRRIMSLTLTFVMVLGMLPAFDLVAWAEGAPSDIVISDVTFGTRGGTAIKENDAYYESPNTGTRSMLHVFKATVNGTTSYAFCLDHGLHMGSSVEGHKWSNPTSYSPSKSMKAILDWYYYHVLTSIQIDDGGAKPETNWDDGEYWNATSRACYTGAIQTLLWLDQEKPLPDMWTDVDDFIITVGSELATVFEHFKMFNNNAERGPRYAKLIAEKITDGTRTFPDYDYYQYKYAGNNPYDDGKGVQSVLVPVLNEEPPVQNGPKVYIKLDKVDENGNPLAGATFGVYKNASCTQQVGTFTTDASGGPYGEFGLDEGQDSATWYVKELSAPAGYEKSGEVRSVQVTKDNGKDNPAQVMGGPFENTTPTKVTPPSTPDAVIQKVDALTGEGIGPATFHIEGQAFDNAVTANSSVGPIQALASMLKGLTQPVEMNAIVKAAASAQGDFELPIEGSTGYLTLDEKLMSEASGGSEVKTLPRGTCFTILEESGDMWHIKTGSDEGWVAHKSCMINLPDVLPSIQYDLTNSYNSLYKSTGKNLDGVTGKSFYPGKMNNPRLGYSEYVVPVVYSVAKKIAAAQKAALAQGDTLKIYEAYRPYEVQDAVKNAFKKLIDSDPAVKANVEKNGWGYSWFISATRLSTHQLGIAIDVSLAHIDSQETITVGGNTATHVTSATEYDMPSEMHELSTDAVVRERPDDNGPFSSTFESNEYAKRLFNIFKNAGMNNLKSEWWHYEDSSLRDYYDSKLPEPDSIGDKDFKVTQCMSVTPEEAAEGAGGEDTGGGGETGGGGTGGETGGGGSTGTGGGAGSGTGSGSGSGSGGGGGVQAGSGTDATTQYVSTERQTDENGNLELQWWDPNGENYIEPGQYTVTEVQPPEGYELDPEAKHLVLTYDPATGVHTQSGPLIFRDFRKKKIVIKKVDQADSPLAGAEFEIYKDGLLITTATTEADGTITFDGIDGKGVDSGCYLLKEIKAPDGYLLPGNTEFHMIVDASDATIEEYVATFVNYEYPSIVIQKTVNGANIPLEGAVFEVQIDAQTLGTFTTTADGTIVIDYATYGKFLTDDADHWTVSVREVTAPDGYILDDDNWQNAEIRKGQKLDPFVFTDSKHPEIHIYKMDGGTKQLLPGATFEVQVDEETLGEFTTDDNGTVTLTHEQYGKFVKDENASWTVSVRETKPPDGYLLDSDDWQIQEVKKGQNVVDFTFTNTKYPGIRIVKKSRGTDEPLAGGVFEVTVNDHTMGSYSTDANGEIVIDYEKFGAFLDSLGEIDNHWTIGVREMTAPDGYLIDDDQWQIQELQQGQAEMVFTFTDTKYPEIHIKKTVSGTNEPLAGALFEVRIDDVDIGEYKTDDNGWIVVDYEDYANFLIQADLQDESWTVSVREKEAPDGYLLDDDNWHEQELKRGQDVAEFTFTDTKYPEIHIYKVSNGTNQPLEGCVFDVRIDDRDIGEFTTDAEGKIVITHDDYGEWILPPTELDHSWTIQVQEKNAPDGYLIDDDQWHIYELPKGQSIAEFTFTDTKYPEIHITKLETGTGKLLPGATFEVRIDGTIIGDFVTDENGQIIIDHEQYGDFVLPPFDKDDSWTVEVREKIAPDGHIIDDADWKMVELKRGQDVADFTFTDTKYPEIHIYKYDTGTRIPLEGAVFDVRIDDHDIGEYVTDEEGKIIITHEDYGDFIMPPDRTDDSWTIEVKERQAPEGYLIDDDNWHAVELPRGQDVAEFTFTDTAYPDIVIIKKDRETGEVLPNCSFRIDIDGREFMTRSTDAQGQITITYEEYERFLDEQNWNNWTITVTEVEPPDLYNLDRQESTGDYTITQQLKWGQSLSVFEFKDTHYRDVKVYKWDAQTGWPLAGARFTLHCIAADEPLHAGDITDRVLETDESGFVVFEDVPNGTYELRETQPPFGYMPNDEVKTVIVTSDSDPVIEFEYENEPKSGIIVRKIDAVTKQPIPNVEFRVTPLAPLTEPANSYTTNDNGIIVLEGLKPGTYRIEETKTVDGYVLSTEVKEVEVTDQHDAFTVIFENNQENMLNILKLDAKTGEPLPGAVFEIRTAGGELVATVTTGMYGYANYAGLKPGSYVVQEVQSPAGHIIDPFPQTLEVKEEDSGKVYTLVFSNSPYTDLYIRKYDDFSNVGLEGAHFKVWKDDTLIAEDAITDASGFIHIGEQTAGMFQIQETKAPQGYVLNEEKYTIYLEDGETGTVEIPNKKPGGLTVHKIDASTGASLEGAIFELRKINGELIGSVTTGKDGYARWDSIEKGWYVLTETRAPEGYILDETPRNIEVKEFEAATIEWENSQHAVLTLTKRDKETEVGLAGATFEVRTLGGELIETMTTDKTGVATSSRLVPGWYIVKETVAPDGYILNDEEMRIEIKENTPATLDVYDEQMTGITLTKVDAVSGEPLSGAVFEISTVNGALIESYTTDGAGSITTKPLEPGVYSIKETQAPDGYVLDDEAKTVEVEAGHQATITVRNVPKSTIQIFKTDMTTGEPLLSAEFDITDKSGSNVSHIITDETGWGSSLPLAPGEYIVRETKAPDGYVMDLQEHEVTVKEGEGATLRLQNAPDTVLYITKVDADTQEPLAGATFEVYAGIVGTEPWTLIGTYVTDEHGIATTQPLTPGPYVIKETGAPLGYVVNDEPHSFAVKAGEYNNLVVEDVKAATLIIRKIDSKTGKPIPGAVFKVENADRMDLVCTVESDANGEALVTGLTEGSYIVTETQAPPGYVLSNPNQHTIYVEYGKNNYCDFEDAAKGSLIIVLQDQTTGDYLAGGEFRVTREDDQIVVYDGSTDYTGTIVVGDLNPGWYFIEQVFAPDDYTMVDVEMHVEVLSGEQQTVYFKDVTASIVIEKIDSQYPELMLEGARFQISRDTDGIVIGEYVTGKDGLVMAKGLIPGLYTVTELVAPNGYVIDDAPKTVDVKGGTSAHVTFMDTQASSITIRILDKATNVGIPGATVEVWHQNGELVASYTSDTTGVIMTDPLPAGYYELRLVKVPAGYTADITQDVVQLVNGVETTYTFYLTAKATLKVMSVDSDGKALSGMKVKITTLDGTNVGEYTTGADGSVIISDLTPGWYVVTETQAPDGYTIADPAEQRVEVKSGEQAVVTFTHSKVMGLQILSTCAQTGVRLAGVVYTIARLDGATVGTFTSNSEGLIYTQLEPGWYVVTPTTAPAGYTFVDSSPRNVEIVAGKMSTLEFQLNAMSSIRVKVVDGNTDAPIYGVRLQLRDDTNVIKEYYTDNEGYIVIDKELLNGKYVLEMISAPDGYIVDTIPKSISTLVASTTEVIWKLYKEGGQIQVVVTSSDYNKTLDMPAGSPIQGAVFQVMNADTYQIVSQMISDASGIAASSVIPIGRYIVSQVSSGAYYAASDKEEEIRIKINNDVVRTTYTNVSVNLKASMSLKSNTSIRAGSSMRVDILTAANESDVRLDNFYVHLKVPTDAARFTTLSTGTWSHSVFYKISYKTNMNDYRSLAENLQSTNNYQYDLSTQSLGLQSGEYVTDIRFEFGTVPAGFKLTSRMCFTQYVLATVYNQYKLINHVELGGQHNAVNVSTTHIDPNNPYSTSGGYGIANGGNAGVVGGYNSAAVSGNSGQWTTATETWTCVVSSSVTTPSTLPKTGY